MAAVGEQQSLPREADNTSPPGTGLQDHQCSSHVFTSRLLWCHHARHTVGCVDTGAWPEILQAAFPGVHQMSLTAGSEATARGACRDPPGLAQHPHTRAQPRGKGGSGQPLASALRAQGQGGRGQGLCTAQVTVSQGTSHVWLPPHATDLKPAQMCTHSLLKSCRESIPQPPFTGIPQWKKTPENMKWLQKTFQLVRCCCWVVS